jgi:hypothetical protein
LKWISILNGRGTSGVNTDLERSNAGHKRWSWWLEIEFDGFAKVCEGFIFCSTLAGNIYFKT